MDQRPKSTAKQIVFTVLSIVCLAVLVMGMLYIVQKSGDIARGFVALIALWVGVVIFLNHLDDLIINKAPFLRLLLLFVSLSAWGILIPFVTQGIWGGIMTAFSLGAMAGLADFFATSRKWWHKTEIIAPIFLMTLLLGGYIDHIIEGPWSNEKIVLIGIRGILLLCLVPPVIGRIKSNLTNCRNVGKTVIGAD